MCMCVYRKYLSLYKPFMSLGSLIQVICFHTKLIYPSSVLVSILFKAYRLHLDKRALCFIQQHVLDAILKAQHFELHETDNKRMLYQNDIPLRSPRFFAIWCYVQYYADCYWLGGHLHVSLSSQLIDCLYRQFPSFFFCFPWLVYTQTIIYSNEAILLKTFIQ